MHTIYSIDNNLSQKESHVMDMAVIVRVSVQAVFRPHIYLSPKRANPISINDFIDEDKTEGSGVS